MNVNIYRRIQNTNRLGDNKLKKNGGGLIQEKRCEALKLKRLPWQRAVLRANLKKL